MYFREHLRLRKLPWQKQSWSRNRARRRVGCVILVLIPGAAFFHRNGYETCSWNTGRGFANCKVDSVVSDSVRLHRRQPTRLPHPWDSPGKNTGVGCPTLCNPMNCSTPGFPVHHQLQEFTQTHVSDATQPYRERQKKNPKTSGPRFTCL